MADVARELKQKYKLGNRYANFGPVIRRLTIDGFRGINALTIEPSYPVTAFSGLNGSGKSTVGQLMSCAYRRPSTAVNYHRYYVKDFFPFSVVDPTPFGAGARAMFTYETSQVAAPQEVTVSRVNTEWSGYKRQPERYCYYVGFMLYIPKVERRDLSIYRASTLELREVRELPDEVATWVSQILNQSYDRIHFQGVAHSAKESELGVAQRFGSQYSENHMGFGEGRVLYMVALMERAPEQSLFILEEPATSLHEEAQFRLARYLLEVCNRRHHQIVLSTHSSAVLEALPSEARIVLYRDNSGVTAYPGISATHARSLLSGGYQRALSVAVEDAFARSLLEQIIRSEDPQLLKTLRIMDLGCADAVVQGVALLKKAGQNAIAVRDADTAEDRAQGLYTLPGTRAPELEVFECDAVRVALLKEFGLNVAEYLVANPVEDHHDLPRRLADAAETEESNLCYCAIRAYVGSLADGEVRALVGNISGHV